MNHNAYPADNNDPTANYDAHRAFQFSTDNDGKEVAPDDAFGSLRILDDMLDEQRLGAPENGWKWTRGDADNEYYYNTEYGIKVHEFADGSLAWITITNEADRTNPNPKSRDDLRIAFVLTHPEDPTAAQTIQYHVHQGQPVATTESNTTFGATITSMLNTLENAEAEAGSKIADMDEDAFERLLGDILAEGEDLMQGTDPDEDPMRVIARAEDPIYKAVSDSARSEIAGYELAKQLGMSGERLVSQAEARALADLIRSL